MVSHPFPNLDSLRFARLSDVPRISVVAAAGFHSSPVFRFERLHHNRYPRDTLASYRTYYEKEILDPNTVVLVIEACYKKNEVKDVYDALSVIYPSLYNQLAPMDWESETLIVGVASLTLQRGSDRQGQFLPEDKASCANDPWDCNRDRSFEASEQLDKYLTAPQKRWFSRRMEITTIVVHPTYWHQGNGTKLAKWCVELASMDHTGIGVTATPMGKGLFEHMGFIEKQNVEVKGYEGHRGSIKLWIGIYDRGIKEIDGHCSTPSCRTCRSYEEDSPFSDDLS